MKDWLPLGGVVIAQFVLVGLYFAKLRADDKRRWHEKRLDAYRALSRAGRDASLVFAEAEQPEDLDDRQLVEAMAAADACSLDIALLSSETVREKADALQTCLEMCVIFDVRSEAFPTAAEMIAARHDFENAVRQELGIDRSKRQFFIEADSRAELAWRALEVVLRIGYGSLGQQAARRQLSPR